jgi:cardiolipin synthase
MSRTQGFLAHPFKAYPVTTGNSFRLLPSGRQTFEAVLADIEQARTRVWLETYIFVPDEVGQRVLDALVAAAERGCDVILLVDRFGAHSLRDKHVEPLRKAGGHAIWFNPLLALKPHSAKVSLFGAHRDHRKILVVDDRISYTGGRNVALEYVGAGPDSFYDVMVRIEGPATRDFASIFLETLFDTCDIKRDIFPAAPGEGDVDIRVLQLDLREHVGQLDHAIVDLIQGARDRLLLCTPYLIPPKPILAAILDAPARGVDVRLLTCGRSDVPMVQIAGRHLYKRLLDAGVRIWEHEKDILHAKFYVADGRRTIIGSYNADRWGQRYNQEVAAEMLSEDLAGGLAKCFHSGATIEITREMVAGRPWYARAASAFLWGLSTVLAPDASGRARDRSRTAPR